MVDAYKENDNLNVKNLFSNNHNPLKPTLIETPKKI